MNTSLSESNDARKRKAEFLSFRLGGEEYGIAILKVQEIREFEPPTRLANAPDYILGVLNLRGTIVPVVDMRLKFHLPEVHYNAHTVTIVLMVADRVIGMVVDSVSDVIALDKTEVMPAPQFSATLRTEHIVGVASPDPDRLEQMILLVDIERLMGSDDMGLILTQSKTPSKLADA